MGSVNLLEILTGLGFPFCYKLFTLELFLWLGRVIDGLLVLRKIENVPTGPNNKPKIAIVIAQCGEM